MRKKLTDAFLKQAKAEPGAERTIYWDTTTPGFGLMVTAAGHKSFVFQYRRGHRGRRMKLDGKFLHFEEERERKSGRKTDQDQDVFEPSRVTTLAAAKREAAAVRGARARGRDPLAEMRK